MNGESSANTPKPNHDVVHRHSASYNLFILALTLFSVIGLVGLLIPSVNNAVILRVDFFICMIFLIDFLVNLWRAPSKANYFFKQGGWLDLLGATPTVPGVWWTPFLRPARLNRLVRIVKHLEGKDRDQVLEETRRAPAKTMLLTMVIATFTLITIASLLILTFERGVVGANIKTGGNAFWWAVVTITTVGYGDFVPVTFPGRVLAIALMTFGIGIFAVLTSFMAARLVNLHDDRQPDLDEIAAAIREENAVIRSEVAELKALLKQQETMNDKE